MDDTLDRVDILNKERFLDIIYGESDLQLGTVEGTYRNAPCELLVMITEDPTREEGGDVAVKPLAVFLSEEDLSYIDISYGSDVEVIEFDVTTLDGETDLKDMKPKGPLH